MPGRYRIAAVALAALLLAGCAASREETQPTPEPTASTAPSGEENEILPSEEDGQTLPTEVISGKPEDETFFEGSLDISDLE